MKDGKIRQRDHTSAFQVFLGPAIMNRIVIMNAALAPTNDLKNNLRWWGLWFFGADILKRVSKT